MLHLHHMMVSGPVLHMLADQRSCGPKIPTATRRNPNSCIYIIVVVISVFFFFFFQRLIYFFLPAVGPPLSVSLLNFFDSYI